MVAKNFKLYGMGVSTCTQKVVMTLKEKHIPFEFININVIKQEQKLPEHLARHPFGKIPVLEDEDGNFLFESLAIVRYLNALYPDVGAKLVPSEPKKASVVDQWTYQSSYNFYPHVQGVIFETAIKPARKLPTDQARLESCRAALEPTLDIYEKHLSAHLYFANDEFSLADLAHIPYFNVINRTQPDLIESRPAVAAWFKRCTERESWQGVLGWVKEVHVAH
ncbi:hypothetical protein HDV00_004661 [Rhizophlyctis rosea]|nr:hypothetical protein HDV00_004661 [Rhizophlyctis rosea]